MSFPEKMKRMPSLLALCIDGQENNTYRGKCWDLYHTNPMDFYDVPQLLLSMDNFFTQIGFPEATIRLRQFKRVPKEESSPIDSGKKELSVEELLKKRGKQDTFFITVENRASCNWQGEVYCVDTDEKKDFYSELELLKFIKGNISNEK